MVALSIVQASNAALASAYSDGLVAVFVGATSGIGEATLKEFTRCVCRPRVYFVGRSEASGKRITAECKALNPDGEYIFISADVSLLVGVDEACARILEAEKAINLLFCCQGVLDYTSVTKEDIDLMTSLLYFSRMRFTMNLLPLLQNATHLRRVVSVFAGGKEGQVDTTNPQARITSVFTRRNQIASMITLGMEEMAQQSPRVSFVHVFPGLVRTPALENGTTAAARVMGFAARAFGAFICVPLGESGQRHLFLATSPYFRAAEVAEAESIPQALTVAKDGVALGTLGEGSGVYSVNWDGESVASKMLPILREKGIPQELSEYRQNLESSIVPSA